MYNINSSIKKQIETYFVYKCLVFLELTIQIPIGTCWSDVLVQVGKAGGVVIIYKHIFYLFFHFQSMKIILKQDNFYIYFWSGKWPTRTQASRPSMEIPYFVFSSFFDGFIAFIALHSMHFTILFAFKAFH